SCRPGATGDADPLPPSWPFLARAAASEAGALSLRIGLNTGSAGDSISSAQPFFEGPRERTKLVTNRFLASFGPSRLPVSLGGPDLFDPCGSTGAAGGGVAGCGSGGSSCV